MTNAPSIDAPSDEYYQVGGSLALLVDGAPVAVGGDFMIVPDGKNKDINYYGVTISSGIGTSGGEFHVGYGVSKTIENTEFNVFDAAEGIYIKIMGW